MAFRFRKSKKIAPGVKLNLGKKSAGISFGNKRGGISFNTRSGARVRSSIPGTGISFSSKIGGRSRSGSSKKEQGCLASILLLPFYVLYFLCICPFIWLYRLVKKTDMDRESYENHIDSEESNDAVSILPGIPSKPKQWIDVVMWVLSIFMTISAFVFIPSAASIIMFLFAVIAAPVKPLQDFFKSKGLSGIIKGILLTVLFFVSVALAPTSKELSEKNGEKKSISVREDRNAAANLTEITPVSSQKPEKPEEKISPDEKLKSDILSYLQEHGIQDPRITVLERRIEIDLFSDFSEDDKPEKWDAFVNSNVDVCNSLKDKVEGINGRDANMVIRGSEKSILLTIIGGKCKYDFYNDADKVYLGSSRVSFEKHPVKKGDEVLFDIKVGNTTKAEIESVSSGELTEFMNKIDFSGTNGNAVLMFEDGTGLNIMQIGASQYADYGYMDVSDGEYTMTERLGAIWNDTESGWYYKTIDEMHESDNAEAVTESNPELKAENEGNENDSAAYDNISQAGSYDSTGRTIYITKTGKKYHYDNNCNGGTYFASTLDEVLRRGLKPCSKCVN